MLACASTRSIAGSLICYRAYVELQREAKSHILNHDNIVQLYAITYEPGHYGVIMEYVQHGDLKHFIFLYKVSCV